MGGSELEGKSIDIESVDALDVEEKVVRESGKNEWWKKGASSEKQEEPVGEKQWFKREERQVQNDIMEVAKKQHMNTDVKKAVF